MSRVFLDHAAGQQNPNSIHTEGRESHAILDYAKAVLAKYIHASSPDQIIFAPSASLANYFLLSEFHTVIPSAIEHQSILNHPNIKELIPVNKVGKVLEQNLHDLGHEILLSTALANHEIGTIQNIKKLAKIAHDQGFLFHTDASAALTKIPINVSDLDIDSLTLSGPKIGVPGIAAIYAKNPTKSMLKFPFGTANIPAILALSRTLEQHPDLPDLYKSHVLPLRDHLLSRLTSEIEDVAINGDPKNHLPNLINLSFRGAEGESILAMLDLAGISVSTGSACALGEPSHVIMAITGDPVAAHNSIRISLSPSNTRKEIDIVADELKKTITKLREYTTQ